MLRIHSIRRMLGSNDDPSHPPGRGAFGSVHRGLNMLNGEVVAMKRIRLGIDVPVNEVASILVGP